MAEKRHVFLHDGKKMLEWDQTLEEVNIYERFKGNTLLISIPILLSGPLEDDVMHITLQKRDKGHAWSSPILGQGQLDPLTSDLEQKRVMLQRFQEENSGFDFSQAQFIGTCPNPRIFLGGIHAD